MNLVITKHASPFTDGMNWFIKVEWRKNTIIDVQFPFNDHLCTSSDSAVPNKEVESLPEVSMA